MKRILSILFLFLASTKYVLAAEPINTTFFGGLAIDGYDAVAYWTENKAVKGKKQFSYEWWGAVWRFSSEENLKAFSKDPHKFAPEYGGYCAYAMSDNRLVGIDPEAFDIYNGKLYLNYSKSVQKHWKAEKDKFIEEADGFYPNKVNLPEK